MDKPNEINRYDFIDALRGFAILAVILTHAALISLPSYDFLRMISDNGARGVQLFYVASALTLFLSMEERSHKESKPVRNFFIRRFFRIAPLFYIAIIVYTFIYGPAPREFAPNGIQWWQYPLTFAFLNGWHPEAINSILPIEWSVAVEMTFYLCIPFLFSILKDLKSTILFIIGSLLLQYVLSLILDPILVRQYPHYQYMSRAFLFFWFFSQLPVFGIGIAAYHAFRMMKNVKDKKLGIALLILSVFLFVVFLNVKTFQGLIQQHVLYGLAFLVFALALHAYPTRLLVNPVTRWIGKVSYSIYLVHFAVIELLKRILPEHLPVGKTIGFFLAYILILLLAAAISALTYRFIEVPGMNLGKRLIHKLDEQPALAQPAR